MNVGKIDMSSNFLAKVAFSNPPKAKTIAVRKIKEKGLDEIGRALTKPVVLLGLTFLLAAGTAYGFHQYLNDKPELHMLYPMAGAVGIPALSGATCVLVRKNHNKYDKDI